MPFQLLEDPWDDTVALESAIVLHRLERTEEARRRYTEVRTRFFWSGSTKADIELSYGELLSPTQGFQQASTPQPNEGKGRPEHMLWAQGCGRVELRGLTTGEDQRTERCSACEKDALVLRSISPAFVRAY